MSVNGRFGAAIILAGCLVLAAAAPAWSGPEVMAEIDGEPLLRSDVEQRIRDIHRYQPGVRAQGEAAAINVAEIVNALVDERLMIREAERLGLGENEQVRRGMEEFIRNRTVLQLRQDEVMDKAQVSEEEVRAAFQTRYAGQENMGPDMEARTLERIRKTLQRKKIQERSESYVEELGRQAAISVERELLDAMTPGQDCPDGDRIVARVNDVPIPAREIQAEMDRAAGGRMGMVRASHTAGDMEVWVGRIRDKALQAAITYILVEQEAKRRGLADDSEIAIQAEARRRELLVQALQTEIIAPLAEPGEKELRAYLAAHPAEFSQGSEVWYSQMRFANPDESESILEELKQGADFEYLAGRVSADAGSNQPRVWVRSADLAPEVRKELESMQPGEVSGVVSDGRSFWIFKLKGRRGGAPLPFEQVRDNLRRVVGRQNFVQVQKEYLEKLRDEARITVHRKALEGMEAEFWKPLPNDSQSPPGGK